MGKPMLKFMIWFCLTLTIVTVLLISLASCDGCVMGDASTACINRSIHATETYGADQWHIQQTEMAK